MGESKRRKQSDPRYGEQKRGLVVSNPIEIEGTRLNAKSSNLDPQELRFALLFWDELAWPTSRTIHFANGPEEDFLQREGILTRPEITVWGDAAQGLARTQIQAFEKLNTEEPGKWTLAQGENSFLLREGFLIQDHGSMLDLHRAIPVPRTDVPLNDILEFKSRRLSELGALRSEIDSFFTSLANSVDKEADLAKHVERIDASCADAIKVVKEWQVPFKLVSTKTSFEFRPLVTIGGALIAFDVASSKGLPLNSAIVASFAGGALATSPALKIATDFGWKGLRPSTNPYRYVAQYHREVF